MVGHKTWLRIPDLFEKLLLSPKTHIMRKLYALVLGLIVLVTTKTNGQLNPQDLFFETLNITSTGSVNDTINETCQASFEVSGEASSPLTKKFTAEPWHSEQKRPVTICWKF